jgi:glycosyltransferase involved in cell wall biosynthesis
MMRVWLIQIGEPLPIDGDVPRLLRTGVLAQQLADRGHQVTWWCSTFNHWTKSHRYPVDTTVELSPAYRLRLLHSPGYRRNVSVRRIVDHRILAARFRTAIEQQPPPDLIVASFPTVEMSEAAAVFGNAKSAPVIMDVRDLWPDAFLNLVPAPLKPLGKLFLSGLQRQAGRALARSDAIVGVSQSYLDWALNIAQRGRRENDGVIPLGYERSSPSVQALRDAEHRLRGAGVDPERVICWFIGTFGRTYDLETVIEVARALHERHEYRSQFVLSGDGGRLDDCRKLAAGLPNVVFTGWVNSTEIEWLMSVAGIGLAAYVRDAPQSLPNKLFEYLAAGLPIVSSLGVEAAGLLDSNGCGLTYEPGNPDSLFDQLVRLLDDPLLRKSMSSKALQTFQAKYSTRQVYESFIELIERLGAPSRAPSSNACSP